MTLDASGNLGVGTTSPGARLEISGSGNQNLIVNSTSSSSYMQFANSGGITGYIGSSGGINSGGGNNALGLRSQNEMVFATGGSTERARITSGGDLLVGTTSSPARLTVLSTSASATNAYIESNAANYTGAGIYSVLTGSGNNNTTAALFTGYNITNGDVFRVYGNGNVVNTNNSYGAISDAKLKDNIIDATPKLEKLNQVRIVNFNMIGSEQKQLGVIAQELEQVFPGMVDETPDRDQEGNDLGTTTKSVKYSVFVPMLIKAIQEQQAIIEQLKARLDAANL
jgi:hypothetical protein